MIRRLNESEPPPVAASDSAFPSLDQPFTLEDRPPGIRFYVGRASWFHPYLLLQSMSYTADSLKIVFAGTDVVIRGRGLHELYRRLAEHRIAAVVEQGLRHGVAAENTTLISRIEHTIRSKKKASPAESATDAEPEE